MFLKETTTTVAAEFLGSAALGPSVTIEAKLCRGWDPVTGLGTPNYAVLSLLV